MYNPSVPLPQETQKQIENSSKNSLELNTIVNVCMSQSDGQSFTTADCSGSLEFKNRDLLYSIGKANYEISGEKFDSIYWNVVDY